MKNRRLARREVKHVTKISLPDMWKFCILDEETGETHLGSNQEWYSGEFQKHAGCGPAVAANLIHYLLDKRECGGGYVSKKDFVALMEEVWCYVTPIEGRGLPSTDLFYRSLLDYSRDKGFQVSRFAILDMHTPGSERPKLPEIIRLLENGLSCGLPVAFLSLNSGEEKNLDEWHWVTVISLEHGEGQAYAEVMDEGKIKRADLSLWYGTTTLGGGFVYFDVSS